MKWLIDAGHGGFDSQHGYYQTAPAKNKFAEHGVVKVYEGVVTRNISSLLVTELLYNNLHVEKIHEQFNDTTIAKRVQLINDIYSNDKDCFLISLHAESKADGFEVYGHKAELFGERLAKVSNSFGSYKIGAQEEDEEFIKQVRCKAVIINLLSVYKPAQAEQLRSQLFIESLAVAILNVVKQIEQEL